MPAFHHEETTSYSTSMNYGHCQWAHVDVGQIKAQGVTVHNSTYEASSTESLGPICLPLFHTWKLIAIQVVLSASSSSFRCMSCIVIHVGKSFLVVQQSSAEPANDHR